MIPFINRFHGHGALNKLFRSPRVKVVRSKHFMLKWQNNDRARSYKVAVVVSSKVAKSAVVRNRIRRRIYEVVRTHNLPKGVEMAVFVHDKHLATCPSGELKDQFRIALNKIG